MNPNPNPNPNPSGGPDARAGSGPDAEGETLFDPHSVPVFPRIAMEINTTDRTISVAGTPHQAEADDDLIDVAVTAAAGQVQTLGLTHARVAAVVDDQRFNLVVGADGQRYDLDTAATGGKRARGRTPDKPAGKPAARKPVWPILVAAAAVMLVISTSVGIGVAWQQRQQLASQPVAPSTPPPAELPIVPTDAWSTRATWAVPVQESADRAVIALTDSSLITVTPDDTLTALDPATGVLQWSSRIPGGRITAGPLLTSIDDQPVVAVVASDRLVWWPSTGAAAPVGQIELDNNELVTFDGTSPLITGRGQLARIIVAGQPVERTIPAGAQAVRADADTVLALNSLGQYWRLTTADVYVPKPRRLAGTTASQPVTYLGTRGQVVALQTPAAEGAEPQIRLYSPTGKAIGQAIPGSGRTLEATAHSTWAVIGTTLVDTTTGAHQPLPETWQTAQLERTLYGKADGQLITVDPAGKKVTAQPNPDATPPIASTTTHGYYVANNNDGDPQLYAVTPTGT